MSLPTPVTPKSFPPKGHVPNTRRENGQPYCLQVLSRSGHVAEGPLLK